MLSRPFALAARPRLHSFITLRSYSTNPFSEGDDKLNQLLGVNDGENSTASLWGSNASVAPLPEDDPTLANPPKAPVGSLPAASPPPPRSRTQNAMQSHALPKERHFHLHVFASRNNTILTLTNHDFQPKMWVSAGLCGFKKVQRSGYEAGYQCAVRMFARIAEENDKSHLPFRLDVAFKGYGFGREAVFRALMASEGDKIRGVVAELKDATPIKVGGGPKARKTRRL